MRIFIRDYQFELSAPYVAGSRLTSEEASAFNEFRARGVAWNCAKIVLAECAKLRAGEFLSDAQLTHLQSQISDFEITYRHPIQRNRNELRGAIEQASWEIAGHELEAHIRATGQRLSQEDFDDRRNFLASTEEYRNKARAMLRARKKASKESFNRLVKDLHE